MGLSSTLFALQVSQLMRSKAQQALQDNSRNKMRLTRQSSNLSTMYANLMGTKKISLDNSALTWNSFVEYNKNADSNPIRIFNEKGEEIFAGEQSNVHQSGDVIFADDLNGSWFQTLLLNGAYTLKDLSGNTINLATDSRFTIEEMSSDEINKNTAEIKAKMEDLTATGELYDLEKLDLETMIQSLTTRIESLEKTLEGYTGSGSSFDYPA